LLEGKVSFSVFVAEVAETVAVNVNMLAAGEEDLVG
jgi:hypothetical protein